MSLADAQNGVNEELFAELLHQIFGAILQSNPDEVAVQRQFLAAQPDMDVATLIPGQGQLVSTVYFRGDWAGWVTVTASERTTDRLVAVMHGEHEPDSEDRCDALGEVANIVAGNAKGLLTGENTISLPTVTIGGPLPGGDEPPETWSWEVTLPVGLITVHLVLNLVAQHEGQSA